MTQMLKLSLLKTFEEREEVKVYVKLPGWFKIEISNWKL